MKVHAMTCDAFDARLSEYLEEELTLADRRAVETHVASCVRCTALLRDLEAIRVEANAMPELTPSRDLWSEIAHRIEAPVVPLVPQTPVVVFPARRRSFDRLRLAAVAAALVAVTAGVTYTLTVLRLGRGDPVGQVATARPDSAGVPDTSAVSRDIAPSNFVEVASADSSVGGATDELRQSTPTAQPVRSTPDASTSSREIDRLRAVFLRNRHQLDPRTAAIIEANLKVIDDAIAQSKEALSQDPASRFLNDQLNNALDKKLELLRTAALLPQRT